jgi:hypothetical protein
MRAYTHGWDTFTPNLNIMYHQYTRADAPKFWNDKTYKSPIEAERKVQYLTNPGSPSPQLFKSLSPRMQKSLQKYGLGTARSKDSFFEKVGFSGRIPFESPDTTIITSTPNVWTMMATDYSIPWIVGALVGLYFIVLSILFWIILTRNV